MQIVEYFSSDRKATLLESLVGCDWEAARFLTELLEKNSFEATLGAGGQLFFLMDEERPVSFLTLTHQDCIDMPEFFPWIGFVYTFPEYRGRRCAGILLEHARKCAAAAGFPFVFLGTDHVGLYEKYGFEYWGDQQDRQGESCRLYVAPAQDIFLAAEAAQARARQAIRSSGVIAAWETLGAQAHPVGSMAMGLLMKHRDIDFHIYTDRLDVAASFRAIAAICAVPGVTRLEYRNLADTGEACLEWHAWFALDGEEWQIDMIQIRRGSQYDGYFEHVAERIRATLTPETKRAILTLKFLTPETEHIMGIEYYQAVIAGGVRTRPQFVQWRKDHPVNGICTWCP